MIEPEFTLQLCRFAFDGAALFLWGSGFYLCLLAPLEVADEIARRLRRPLAVTLSVVFLSLVISLPINAAMITDGWPNALVFDTLRSVLLETTIGTAWEVQISAILLYLLATYLPKIYRPAVGTLAAGSLVAGLSLTGHAEMNSGWLRTLHQANDALHVLAAGAWLGALPPVLLTLQLIRDGQHRDKARMALMRFSTAGHAIVVLVLATGIANAILITGGLPMGWSLPYRQLLSLKLVLVGVLLILAIWNRYVHVPDMARNPDRAINGLVRFTVAEIAVGLVIIALVAWLGILDPN
jgi:putative copper resistance protein D